MTVYFVVRCGNQREVKIGHTDDLPTRLTQLSSYHEDGIELVAQCEGDRSVEAGFHALLDDHRLEGEWFHRSELLDGLIRTFSGNVVGRRIFARTKVAYDGDSALDQDLEIMRHMLAALFAQVASEKPICHQQEAAFQVLSDRNAMWSRRRIRALWEGKSRRVELYEARDLQAVLTPDRRMAWAAFIAPELNDDQQEK